MNNNSFSSYIILLLVFLVAFIVLYPITLLFFKGISPRKRFLSKKELYILKNREMQSARQSLEYNLRQSPSEFYSLKNSCMTVNESRMFYYINTVLNELLPDPAERATYYVFPQVALYSLVNLQTDLAPLPREIATKNYIAKSIDFVICRCNKQKYRPYVSPNSMYNYYAYTPILLIELDGQSHYSPTQYGKKNYNRQQENDSFKNALSAGLKIPLLRYRITNNYLSSKDMPYIKQMLAENLP